MRRLSAAYILLLASSCGRIGLDLLPFEADNGDDSDDSGDSGDTSWEAGPDANADPDGSMIALDAAIVDARVEPNICIDVGDAGYQPVTSCGVGYCRSHNSPSHCVGPTEIACQPGAALSSTDATCDGVDDNCSGTSDEDYSVLSCGTGYCRSTAVPSSCTDGVETSCKPGTALRPTDSTCDNVDDNCSGVADEGYTASRACGVGYCRTNNTPSSCTAGLETLCRPAAPLSANDATADGVDDDCDGVVDEDACVPRTDTYAFRAAAYAFLPPVGCTRATVKLWGGGGATGNDDGGAWGASITGGAGGAGGYATSVLTVSSASMIQIYVGQGGQGCVATSTGNATYRGGAGGASNGGAGAAGADGSVTGGSGGTGGGKGGNGSFGGGGGASGARLYLSSGAGGDGGGGTVLLLNSTRTVVAGGGGGGGGAGTTVIASGVSGVAGGVGCSGAGVSSGAQGGGGGGGGICQGTSTQAGTGVAPFNGGGDLAPGAAVGGAANSSCQRGGNGYATVTYAP